MSAYDRYERALRDVEPPFAFVDLDALWANAADLLRRASGTPIRVASKSLRCRPLLRAVLDRDPGFRGLMTFTAPETAWLRGHGFDDLLLAYPTTDRGALRALAGGPVVMIDSTEHLDLIAQARPPEPVRVCIDFDTSLELGGGRLRIGAKRSPIRTPVQAAALARAVVRHPDVELAAVMGYEAHIAGVGDEPPNRAMAMAVRAMQRAGARQLAGRRAAMVDAVRAIADVPIVNGGGTGSIETTAAERVVTEVTAGSGLYAPTLFDRYTRFAPTPAAFFCLPVVRRPDGRTATLLGGGYPASGAAGRDRLPVPALPPGLELTGSEGAGEVQTPLVGPGATRLRVGDRVFLRHAKAGELCERFTTLHLVQGDRVVDEAPTYRGEGFAFL